MLRLVVAREPVHVSTEMDTESSATSEAVNNSASAPDSTESPRSSQLKLPCQVRTNPFLFFFLNFLLLI